MKKKLPIGISDFRKVIEENYYYVDKSLLIKEMVDSGSETILFPRPRRFGKTLNLSMLRYFYEKTDEDTSHLFRNLAIWQQGDAYQRLQGQHPVIYLTLKDVRCVSWEQCYQELRRVIGEEYRRHRYILEDGHLDVDERKQFLDIIAGKADQSAYRNSLLQLSEYLAQFHARKTIILIDEYDTPIQEGFLHDYDNDVIRFMRHLFSGAFKDNTNLEKGALTGILRVAKESVFSGLNNLQVCSLLVPEFSTHFGLLESEVAEILHDYGAQSAGPEVKDWYNGYRFGEETIYNPWSILNYAASWRNGVQPYWINTSSNDLIRQLLTESGSEIKEELECLVRGEAIRKEIDDNIVFGEIRQNANALWSFLLFSGYLKVESMERNLRLYGELKIPNLEVTFLYENIILNWFESSIQSKQLRMMLEGLTSGDIRTFEMIFDDFVRKTFSVFDTGGDEPEKVYHAFVLGLFVGLRDDYEVKSNRESGYGRYDVMLIPKHQTNPATGQPRRGVIIEFKKAFRDETLEDATRAALQQIEDKQYAMELEERGFLHPIKLAIAFSGKQVRIEQG